MPDKTKEFDFNKALSELRAGQPLTGEGGILTPLVKQLTEAALAAELDSHLANEVVPNRKNGKTTKTLKSTSGSFQLETPRDRAGTFEPQLVKKNQTAYYPASRSCITIDGDHPKPFKPVSEYH